MTRKTCYGYALGLPVFLPVVVMFLAKFSHQFLVPGTMLGWLSLASVLQLTLCGLQYFAFVFFLLGWARGKTPAYIRRATWIVPLWFWVWCSLGLAIFGSFLHQMRFFIMIGLFSIPLGYFYVLLTHLLTLVLARTRILLD